MYVCSRKFSRSDNLKRHLNNVCSTALRPAEHDKQQSAGSRQYNAHIDALLDAEKDIVSGDGYAANNSHFSSFAASDEDKDDHVDVVSGEDDEDDASNEDKADHMDVVSGEDDDDDNGDDDDGNTDNE